MDCEECWAEVDAGRRGKNAVEHVRELAPPHLRERIRGTSAMPRRPPPMRRRAVAAAAVVVVLAGVSVLAVASRRGSEPAAVAAAVAGYSRGRLPGSAVPTAPAPDLSRMGLVEVAAGAGRLGALTVDAYAFRDGAGRRVMVFIGDRPFPMPSGGHALGGPDGPWTARRDGITVLCARSPHELLIVGADDALVRNAAEALDVV